MRKGDDFRIVWGVVIAKDTLAGSKICIGIADTDGIAQFGRNNLV
jgi:hypothetical protein